MATIETRMATDGTPRYRVKVRLPGYPSQSQTFLTEALARDWGTDTEARLRARRGAPEARRRTLSDLVNRYRRHVLPTVSPGTARWREVHLSWWTGRLGHLALDEVTPVALVEARDDLAQTCGPRTTRGYLATLSHAFSLAGHVLLGCG